MVEANAPIERAGRPIYLGIQYARALAAIGVLGFHAAQRAGIDFAAGARGVDLFFVISGFIMWTIGARSQSVSAFLLARVKRIVPLYWLATAFMIFAALLGLFPTLREQLTLPHIAASLFFWPHYAPGSGQIWPVLVPGWTLNYEMFFYAVFALAICLPERLRVWAMTLTMVVLVVLGELVRPTSAWLVTYTNPLLLEFIAGIWIAEALRHGRVLPTLLAIPLAAVALV
ncbi:hypothetical protein LTR94_026084, partial [Friedmanniomyces endolithicus]